MSVIKRPGIMDRVRRLFGGRGTPAPEMKSVGSTALGGGFTNLGTNADPFWAIGGGVSSKLTAVQLASVWNYACSALIAGSVSSVRPMVTVDGVKRDNHELLDLLDNPTPDHGWDEWQYMRALNLGLSGADYLEVYHRDMNPALPVVQLWPYAEGIYRTKVQDINQGRPIITHFERLSQMIDKRRVIRSRFPAGGDYAKGLAPAFAAAIESCADREASLWQLNSYRNRLSPAAIITLPTDDAQEIQQFRDGLLNGWLNAVNSGVPIVQGGGVSDDTGAINGSQSINYQQLTQSAVEADYTASRGANRETITAVWGVPDVLFSASSSTFSNLKEAREWYWTSTVLDYVNTLFDPMNRHLAPQYNASSGGVVRIEPDIGSIEALEPAVIIKEGRAKNLIDLGMPPKQASEHLGLGWAGWPSWDKSRVGPAGARFGLQSPELELADQVAQTKLTLAQAEATSLDAEVEALSVEGDATMALLRGDE